MKKKIISVISIILMLSVIFSTFAGITVNAEEIDLSSPEIMGIRTESGVVTLEWYDYNEDFTGFYVYRSETGKAGTWKKVATTSEMSFSDEGALPNKTYYYTLKTFIKDGKVITASASCPKEKISNKLSRPVFSLAGNSGTGVLLKWDAIKGASGVIVYKSRTGEAGSWTKLKTVKNTKAGSYTDNNVEIGETYFYCFKYWKDVDGVKYYSQSSKSYKLTIKDVAVPENFEVKAVSDGMLVTYDKVPATKGYVIYRSLTGEKGTWEKLVTTKSNNTVSYLDKKVVYGIEYYYCVKSYKNVNGKNIYSDKSDNYWAVCEKGKITISPSATDVYFSELLEKQTIKVYVDGAPKYDTLKYEIKDNTVVSGSWGPWNATNDEVTLTLTRVGPGETTIRLYYDKYPEAATEIRVTADKLDLDDDYALAQDYINQAYAIYSEVLKLLADSQKEGISDIEKAALMTKAMDKIKEATVLLEQANELAQKYAEYGKDFELTNNLLKFTEGIGKIVGDFVDVDSMSSADLSKVMVYINMILGTSGIK